MAPPESTNLDELTPAERQQLIDDYNDEVKRAKWLLEAKLEFGAEPCEYIARLADQLGISKRALKQARRELGVRLVGYAWKLPEGGVRSGYRRGRRGR